MQPNDHGYEIERALARQLHIMELITDEQYSKILKMLEEEYSPLVGSLCEAETLNTDAKTKTNSSWKEGEHIEDSSAA